MGIAKKTDGRYLVGIGVDNANDYRGSAAYRDIYIQLTSSGATEKSEEYLTFLKDYAVNANALGEPIMPPSVNVWISNNGVTTAVEADDVSIDGNNYTICGIKWNGSAWDYSNAGQGSGGSSLPSYTSADKHKVLALGEGGSSTTEVIVPEQSVTTDTGIGVTNLSYSDTHTEAERLVTDGATATLVVNGTEMTATFQNITLGNYAWPAAVSDSYKIVWNGDAGDNGLVTFYGTGNNTYTIELYIGVPTVAPVWEADKIVITPSYAVLSHLQTKIGEAFKSFFASETNVKYFDESPHVLTDDDITNINAVYSAFSAGNTNVVLNSFNLILPIALSGNYDVMFVLPYYSQGYSTISVAARITIVLFNTKDVAIVAEKLYDSRA